jgi:hypothetical protein
MTWKPKIGQKKHKYECVLCNHVRWTYNFPKTHCFCEVEYPNQYMYFQYQVKDFFLFIYQQLKLIFRKRWRLKL